MPRLTKTKLLELREETYRPPEVPDRCCCRCKHWYCGVVILVGVDGESGRCLLLPPKKGEVTRRVHRMGCCDAFEAREDE